MKLSLTLAAWILVVASAVDAVAQSVPLPKEAMARVICGPGAVGPGETACGSGTLLDVNSKGEGLVVTNNHVVADHARGPFKIRFDDGKIHGAVLVMRDAELDLAALKIAQVGARRPAPWTDRLSGEKFWASGYGGNDKLMYMWGNLSGHNFSGRQENFEFTAPTRHGDSGGPVFNDSAQVCGVRWGGYGSFRNGGYPGTSAVHPKCLASFMGRLGLKPTARVPQQYYYDCQPCQPGGQCQPCQPYSQPSQPWQPQQPEQLPGAIYEPDLAPVAPLEPIAQPEPPGSRPVNPAPAPQPQPSPDGQADDCRDSIKQLELRIAELEARKPEKGEKGDIGPAGPVGPKGEQGIAGKDGKDAQFDEQAVAAALLAALPPINVEQQDFNTGEVLDTGQVKLGGTLVLRYGIKGENSARPR